ncbi:hypothetical protein ACHWQZ_G002413 [Mnemiopsis leidyi]
MIWLFLFLTASATAADWMKVEEILGTKLPLNLDTTPLMIKTDPITDLSEFKNIDVRLYDAAGTEAGQIILILGKETLQYKLGYCMVDPEDFPDQPINRNVDGGDMWGISTQDSSGKQVVVTCNGEAVLSIKPTGNTCKNNQVQWSSFWNKDVHQIEFAQIATDRIASKFYSPPRHCTLTTGMETAANLPILLQKSVTVTCLEGYHLIGDGAVMCEKNNDLQSVDGNSPQCVLACGEGTYMAAGTSECKTCTAGSEVNNDGTGCVACGEGEYRSSEMTTCTECEEGKEPNSDKSDCVSCEDGKYRSNGMLQCEYCSDGHMPNRGQSGCDPCPEGTYSTVSMTTCLACSDNQYSAAAATACSTCPLGSVSKTDKSACEKCDAGQYRDGTVTVCTQCPVNTVSDKSGVASCVSCGVGKVSNEERTACVGCGEGEYRSSEVTTCTECEEGKVPNSDKSACVQDLACEEGQYRSFDFTECKECEAGYFPNSNKSGCEKCPDGWISLAGSAGCSRCSDDKMSNIARTECVPFCEWPTIENSLYSGRVREGTEVTFRCLAGFSVIGSSLITCQTDGKFSNTPECKEIVKTHGTKVRISSTPSDMDPYAVIDGNKKTFVQSVAQGDSFPTLNITYHESRTIESVMLYFYRYGDASCSNNPDDCQSTWQRLWGLKVSVGIVEQGEESLKECGTVPEYEPPKFDATEEPEPLLKTVVCKQEITGNWIVIQQTLANQVLQFSEIVFVRDWKVLSSDPKNPFLWDNHPLEIKTDKSRISIKATVDPNSSLLPSYTNMSIGLTIDLHRGSCY